MIAVDLFCGVGGMSLGFKRAGATVDIAIDFDWRHVETYNQNFIDSPCIQKDLFEIDLEYFKGLSSQEIDLVFGGPPCQGFSIGGKQKAKDKRNTLINSFLKIIEILRPKAFIMENVTGILQKNYSELLADFYSFARKIGYNLESPLVLNAKDFGVPQNRKRVFFIGFLNSSKVLEKPKPVFNGINPNIYDAISDLTKLNPVLNDQTDRIRRKFGKPSKYVELINSFEVDKRIIKNYYLNQNGRGIGGFMITNHSDVVKKRFSEAKPGSREKISRYFKLEWNGISPTLRAGTTRANGQFMAPRPIHPTEPRCITVREAARLHSFPDYFDFYPTKWYGNMQIGNSVPPLLAQSVAESVIKTIS